MYKKLLLGFVVSLGLIVALPNGAFAHVIVQPSQVGIGRTQIFTISVPTEKTVPTIALRLVLPIGLQAVMPTVKPGWDITTKTAGNNTVTEIDWSNGLIPVNQRDDFSFSAQVPAVTTTLAWKAYQVYQDGSVVSWDQVPTSSDDATNDKGPYSITHVVNDLTIPAPVQHPSIVIYGAYGFSIVALAFSLWALADKRSTP